VTERELASNAAVWVNGQPYGHYSRYACQWMSEQSKWFLVVTGPEGDHFRCRCATAAELIERATAMGWTPEDNNAKTS